jgi:hypothetical protein
VTGNETIIIKPDVLIGTDKLNSSKNDYESKLSEIEKNIKELTGMTTTEIEEIYKTNKYFK